MPLDKLLALIGFVVVMMGTPGPNNMMLLASGANFGFRRSMPHILGITVGCQVLLVAVALGLGQLLIRYPRLDLVLKVLCGFALIYLAWTLVRPTRVLPASGEIKVAHPLTFLQAAMFQWVNPKAWLMMITAIATYTQPATMAGNVAVIALLFVMVGMPCISVWNLFGASLRTFLQDARRARVFNIGMAVLLMGSMYPLLQ